MDTLILFVIGLALAMDCFTVAISNSSVSGLVKPGIPLKMAIAFAFAHMVFVMAGYWLAGTIGHLFAGVEAMMAFAILGIVGSKMILEARRRHPKTKVFDINQVRIIVVLSIATAMDAFLAGLAIRLIQLSFYLSVVLITITVFILTLSGIAGGEQLGVGFARRTAYLGGIFMLMAAAVVLFQFIT